MPAAKRLERRGAMIVFDGVDGAGKTCQAQRLAEVLRAADYPVILTREPGGSPGAEAIRRLLVEGEPDRWDSVAELLLLYAARRAHLLETIYPALERGDWVISDRFADASRAFQGVAGSAGLEAVEALHRIAVGDFVPDLTFILDIDPAIGLARARARGSGEDRFERKGLAYHRRVREAFHELALADPQKYVLLDASRSIEQAAQAVLEAIGERLGLCL